MSGFGGMLCLDLTGGQAAAFRAFDRLRVVKRAASLGGVESLCSLPILTSQFGLDDAAAGAAGVTRGMMRISLGLEDPDDLIADLTQALEAASPTRHCEPSRSLVTLRRASLDRDLLGQFFPSVRAGSRAPGRACAG